MNINSNTEEESNSQSTQLVNSGNLSSNINSSTLAEFIQSNTASLLNRDFNDIININTTINSVLANTNNSPTIDSSNNNPIRSMFRTNSANRTPSNEMQPINAFSNNATNVNAHTHTHTHTHSHNDLTGDSNMSQVVLDLNSNNDLQANPSSNQIQQGADQQQQQQSQDQSPEQNAANNFFMLLIKAMQSSLPFVFIVIAKIFHQHLLGFFVVLGFMTTLHWSNKTLVNQVQLKEKKQNYKLILLILFLLSNVIVFFLIFKDYKLENCLIFFSTNIQKMDTWNLIWIVVCSDTIIKFILISIKAFLTLLPFSIIPLKKRGNFYSTIETFSFLYRSLTPIHPWLLFLIYSDSNLMAIDSSSLLDKNKLVANLDQDANLNSNLAGYDKLTEGRNLDNTLNSSRAFPIFLCILYAIFKLNQVYSSLSEFIRSVKELLLDMNYGLPVTLNEHDDNICPICQDKYKNPVILKCRHTFCEDCVCVWLDKENSCPVCRARVAVKKPNHKDGSTTILVQWF